MKLNFLIILVITSSSAFRSFSVNKGVIVQLFEWRYSDIALECEEFLAPYGFKGVQISPPTENIVARKLPRPWWERYEPISYRLVSRSGDRKELEDMVNRCNKVGVRIFADVVLNHMTGSGWSAVGVGGSSASPNGYSYPSVPFTRTDFHQPQCDIKDYNNATEVRVCNLLGLKDLNNTMENVRQKQVEFLNGLVDLGIAGFRVDAAKHMYPSDLKNILGRVKNLNIAKGFEPNTRPFVFLEVIDMGAEAVKYKDYVPLGLVTDYQYAQELGRSFLGEKDLVHLKNIGSSNNLITDNSGVVFVDNHDTQRKFGKTFLNHKKSKAYKMAVAFMLAFPHGTPRVMSSFHFSNIDQGPPHDLEYHTLSPRPIKNNFCSNGLVCEHRWREIGSMVRFHNIVKDTEVRNWWDNGKNQISFCRGQKGFIAFNREIFSALDRKLQTCLPQGKYCDVISGDLVNNSCTGNTIEVAADGTAQITTSGFVQEDNNGVLATHIEASITEDKRPSAGSNNHDGTASDCYKTGIGLIPTNSSCHFLCAESKPTQTPAVIKQCFCDAMVKVLELDKCTSLADFSEDMKLLVAVVKFRRLGKLMDNRNKLCWTEPKF